MKIRETNSEQWELNESGVAAVIIGVILTIGGLGVLGWAILHLATTAWWWTLVGVGVAVLGGLVVFSAVNRQVILRRQGASEVIVTRVIGGKETRTSFDASQIVSVNLDTSDTLRTDTDADGDRTTTRERTSVLYVLLNDNSEVMLATSKRSGNSGVSINGFNLSGISKAPLADEAQRIAGFYGVPLSSRANNVSGVEAIASVVGAVRQGIAGAEQQGVVVNAQPQVQVPSQPQQTIVVPPTAQPVSPVVPPLSNGTIAPQVPASESVRPGDQLSR